MRKSLRKLHLWLSLPVGLVIATVCFSGAALVFEREITTALHPELYRVEHPAGSVPLPVSQLVQRIERQFHDTLRVNVLELSQHPHAAWMAGFGHAGRKKLSVDPYTGAVKGWTETPAFFGTLRKLHRWLLDPPGGRGRQSAGKIVVGVSTLLLVFILLTGLILWIPRRRRALANRLRVSCKAGRRRFWYDSHVVLGFYATGLLLLMALTGLTWSFDWYRTTAYAVFGGNEQPLARSSGTPHASEHSRQRGTQGAGRQESCGETAETEPARFDYAVWDRVLLELERRYPAWGSIALDRRSARIAPARAVRRTDTATFDPKDGTIVSVVRYDDLPSSQQLRGWFYALHTGSWGGIWTKILYLFAALIGGTLPLTGCYLWLKRTARH